MNCKSTVMEWNNCSGSTRQRMNHHGIHLATLQGRQGASILGYDCDSYASDYSLLITIL